MKQSCFLSPQQKAPAAEGGSQPNSPSSLVNQYRPEDDEEELEDPDIKDLLISVADPESHVTAIETFIMYRVVTKVTCSWALGAIGTAAGEGGLDPWNQDPGSPSCLSRPHAATLTPASGRCSAATRTSCGSGADWRKVTPP